MARGRKPIGEQMYATFTPEQVAVVREVAGRLHAGESAALRWIVAEWMQHHSVPVIVPEDEAVDAAMMIDGNGR